MSERLFTRRQILFGSIATGVALGTAGVMGRESDLRSFRQRDEGEAKKYFTEKDGILVKGEDNIFNYQNSSFVARVNAEPILDTTRVIAAELDSLDDVENFITDHGLRVVMHVDMEENVGAAYERLKATKGPALLLPTSYFPAYLEAKQSNDKESLRNLNGFIVHELLHLWHDATGRKLRMIEQYNKYFAIGSTVGVTGLEGMSSVDRNTWINLDRRTFITGASISVIAGLAGRVVNESFPHMDVEHHHIRKLTEILKNNPHIAKYDGKHFDFRKVIFEEID